jgi:hypothetical protein
LKRRFLSFGRLVLIICAAIPLQAGWTTSRLTNDAAWSIWPKLAVSGSNVYIVWHSMLPGQQNIWFLKSPDGGATWQRFQRITTGSKGAHWPHIAASGSSVYVVWDDSDEPDGTIYFRRSLDGGATWQAARRIASGAPGFKSNARIAVEGSNVHIVWYQYDEEGSQVYYRKSADGGKTWQAARRLTTEEGISNPLALTADGASVYVAWSHAILSLHQVICFRKSSDRGEAWGPVHRFKEQSGLSMWQTLAASGSSVYLVWSHWNTDEKNNTEIYFAASSNRGAAWGPVARLTDNPKVSGLPACVAIGSKAYAMWADDRSGNFEIYFRTSANGGASWAGANRLTKNAGESTQPDLALGESALYAVWADATPGNHEIYFAVTKFPK